VLAALLVQQGEQTTEPLDQIQYSALLPLLVVGMAAVAHLLAASKIMEEMVALVVAEQIHRP
jgi:hypothetical protein